MPGVSERPFHAIPRTGSAVAELRNVLRIPDGAVGITNYVHEKGRRNRPLNDLQKEFNRLKSQVRCHIEHIFGCVENSMGGPELEYIGLPRIRTGIGLSNLAYNFLRHVQLIRLGRAPA